MRVAIHQPHYFPWPRYLHKVLCSDIFVYLDTVQFDKRFQNRNQIKTANGVRWLTMPVRHQSEQTIAEARLVDKKEGARHFRILREHYRTAPGFQRWAAELQDLLGNIDDSFRGLALDSVSWMLGKLGYQGKCVLASELGETQGRKSALNADICRMVGATEYLTGVGSLTYMNENDFAEFGCRVRVQTWQSPEYPQIFPEIGFVPDLTALDMLFNCPDDSRGIILAAGGFEPFSSKGDA